MRGLKCAGRVLSLSGISLSGQTLEPVHATSEEQDDGRMG
jgi:hypothetical protein